MTYAHNIMYLVYFLSVVIDISEINILVFENKAQVSFCSLTDREENFLDKSVGNSALNKNERMKSQPNSLKQTCLLSTSYNRS